MYVEVLEKGAEGWDEFELVLGSGARIELGKRKEKLSEEEIERIRYLDHKVKQLYQNFKDLRLAKILEAYIDAIEKYPV
ncbi:hypothetical protein [Aquifex sp.]